MTVLSLRSPLGVTGPPRPQVAMVVADAAAAPTTGYVTSEPPWTAVGGGIGGRTGNTTHTLPLGFVAGPGRELVVVVHGAVTHTATGWTERLSPVNSGELSVFTLTASGGETSITITHNGSNFPLAYETYELPVGSSWVNGVQATDATDTFPTLTGLPGTAVVVFAAYGRVVTAPSSSAAATWGGAQEDADVTAVDDGTTDGTYLTVSHQLNITATSVTPTITVTPTGTLAGDRQKVVFAYQIPAPTGDTAAATRLTDTSSLVATVSDDDAVYADAHDWVYISDSCNSATLLSKYGNSTRAVFHGESGSWDDAGVDFSAATTDNSTTGSVVFTAAAVSLGFASAAGLTALYSAAVNIPTVPVASLGPGAIVLATQAADPTLAVVFIYDTGAVMLNAHAAEGRRVAWRIPATSFQTLTAAGLRLWDALAGWAARPVPNVVQSDEIVTAAGQTANVANLGTGAAAGNLLALFLAGDKNTGTATITDNIGGAWSKPVEVLGASVSTYVAYKVATGGEIIVTATTAAASTSGNRGWLAEIRQQGAGFWQLLGSATPAYSDVAVTTRSTGTTAAAVEVGLALAAATMDTVPTGNTYGWSADYLPVYASTGLDAPAGLWVALRGLDGGATTSATITTSTADQLHAAVVVFGRRVPALVGPPVTVTAATADASVAAQNATVAASSNVSVTAQTADAAVDGLNAAASGGLTVSAGADLLTAQSTVQVTRVATESGTVTERAWRLRYAPIGVDTGQVSTTATLTYTPAKAGAYLFEYAATGGATTARDSFWILTGPSPVTSNPAPVVGARATGGQTTDTLTHPITLPAGITNGQHLAVWFSSDAASTVSISSGTGWTLVGQVPQGTNHSGSFLWKVSDGNDALTLATSAVEQSTHVSARITGATALVAASATSGAANPIDPPAVVPGDGVTANRLVMTGISIDCNPNTSSTQTVTPPSGYGNLTRADGNTTNVNAAFTAVADAQLSAGTVDPGTWGITVGEQWVAWTVMFTPAVSAPVNPTVPANLQTAINAALPGDTITIGGLHIGSYDFTVSGTADDPIRFVGDPANPPTLSTTTEFSGFGCDVLAQYLYFEGITFRNGNKAMVIDTGAAHIGVRNCVFEHTAAEPLKIRNSAQYVWMRGCTSRDGGNTGNGEGFYIGTVASNWAPTPNVTPDAPAYIQLDQCTAYDMANDGFDIKEGAHHVKVKRCTADFANSSQLPPYDDVQGDSGFYSRGDYVQFIDCTSDAGPHDGFRLYDITVTAGTYGRNQQVKGGSSVNMGGAGAASQSDDLVIYSDFTATNCVEGRFRSDGAAGTQVVTANPATFTELDWTANSPAYLWVYPEAVSSGGQVIERASTIVENASTTTITGDMTSAVTGDLVIITVSDAGGVPSISTGWTPLFTPTTIAGSTGFGSWYRRLTGAAADTPTATWTTAARATIIVEPFGGVDTTSPLDVAVSFTTTGSTGVRSVTVPSLTTVTDGAVLVSGAAIDGTSSTYQLTAPAGMTQARQSTGIGRRTATATQVQAADGPSGNRTWQQASTLNLAMAAYLVALRPAPVTVAPDAVNTISGLIHRMRPTGLGLANGATVQTVPAEVGGLTYVQATTANRPTYLASGANGRPALRFDGTDDSLASSTSPAAVSQPITVAYVLRPDTGTKEEQVLAFGAGGAELLLSAARAAEAWGGGLVAGGTLSTTAANLVIVEHNGTSTAVYVNGALVATGDGGGGGITANPVTIGRHGSFNGRNYDGDLYEIITYNRLLTSTERGAVTSYAASTYAVPTGTNATVTAATAAASVDGQTATTTSTQLVSVTAAVAAWAADGQLIGGLVLTNAVAATLSVDALAAALQIVANPLPALGSVDGQNPTVTAQSIVDVAAATAALSVDGQNATTSAQSVVDVAAAPATLSVDGQPATITAQSNVSTTAQTATGTIDGQDATATAQSNVSTTAAAATASVDAQNGTATTQGNTTATPTSADANIDAQPPTAETATSAAATTAALSVDAHNPAATGQAVTSVDAATATALVDGQPAQVAATSAVEAVAATATGTVDAQPLSTTSTADALPALAAVDGQQLGHQVTASPSPADTTVDGVNPTPGLSVNPPPADYLVTGQNLGSASTATPVTADAAVDAYTPSSGSARIADPATAEATVAGQNATTLVSQSATSSATTAAASVDAQPPTPEVTITATTGTLTADGQPATATTSESRQASPAAADVDAAAQPLGWSTAASRTAAQADASVDGQGLTYDATHNETLSPTTAEVAADGQLASAATAGATNANALPAALAVDGQAATTTASVSTTSTAATAAASVDGQPATVSTAETATAQAGDVAVVAHPFVLSTSPRVDPATADASLSGQPVSGSVAQAAQPALVAADGVDAGTAATAAALVADVAVDAAVSAGVGAAASPATAAVDGQPGTVSVSASGLVTAQTGDVTVAAENGQPTTTGAIVAQTATASVDAPAPGASVTQPIQPATTGLDGLPVTADITVTPSSGSVATDVPDAGVVSAVGAQTALCVATAQLAAVEVAQPAVEATAGVAGQITPVAITPEVEPAVSEVAAYRMAPEVAAAPAPATLGVDALATASVSTGAELRTAETVVDAVAPTLERTGTNAVVPQTADTTWVAHTADPSTRPMIDVVTAEATITAPAVRTAQDTVAESAETSVDGQTPSTAVTLPPLAPATFSVDGQAPSTRREALPSPLPAEAAVTGAAPSVDVVAPLLPALAAVDATPLTPAGAVYAMAQAAGIVLGALDPAHRVQVATVVALLTIVGYRPDVVVPATRGTITEDDATRATISEDSRVATHRMMDTVGVGARINEWNRG